MLTPRLSGGISILFWPPMWYIKVLIQTLGFYVDVKRKLSLWLMSRLYFPRRALEMGKSKLVPLFVIVELAEKCSGHFYCFISELRGDKTEIQ
ncbi:hypothetical protein V6N11_058407 [Hibiscus sabdariffa]|uniref:Uncharacterized protein n=1 Tax=Hibiscus sabdariffa TaxID=183260 RepID=A0ABR2U4G1_9ROSI